MGTSNTSKFGRRPGPVKSTSEVKHVRDGEALQQLLCRAGRDLHHTQFTRHSEESAGRMSQRVRAGIHKARAIMPRYAPLIASWDVNASRQFLTVARAPPSNYPSNFDCRSGPSVKFDAFPSKFGPPWDSVKVDAPPGPLLSPPVLTAAYLCWDVLYEYV